MYFVGRLFIADTNNSLIRYLDLKGKKPELLTLELKGVQPPAPKSRSFKRLRRRSGADTETIVVNGISSNEGNLTLKISVPEGYHFSKVSPYFLSLVFSFSLSLLFLFVMWKHLFTSLTDTIIPNAGSTQ